MSRPLISVTIPCYNMATSVAECLDSIVGQSYPPDELILVDDGSTDGSREIMEGYARRFSFIQLLKHEKNRGFAAAAKTANDAVTGVFVHTFAADDVVLPGFYAAAADLARRYPQAGAICGQLVARRTTGDEVRRVSLWNEPLFAPPEKFRTEYLEREISTHSLTTATLFRVDAFHALGGYRRELGYVADHFIFRALGMRHGLGYIPFPCAVFRIREESFGSTMANDIRKRLDVFGRMAWLMRSPEFRADIPEDHTRRWHRRVVGRSVLRHAWMALRTGHLIEALSAPRWLFYRPDLSCYEEARAAG